MTGLIAPEAKVAGKVFSALKKRSEQRQQEQILSMLESNMLSIEQAKLKSPSYLACIIRTIEAVERASVEAKVNALKNLFIVSETQGIIEHQPDFYQEILAIFSELSYREIMILHYLSEGGLPYTDDLHVKEPERVADDDSLPNPHEQYSDALDHCVRELNVKRDVVGALLGRLSRTGLIGNAEEWTSLVYFFTPLYRDLKLFFSHEYYQS
ncbi:MULTISPECIES: hypothetical protein [Pseudoalteromonas]|uniref:DUF4393 domain-containing protein n=1 Tax=Pseudoalteromonas aurantia 208 TaxID=1314867 RepID=A0ABR9EI22_9GAMM|nr:MULTISPECIES: hypothetical protein [Pseudoalteromonas]MBE0370645.1 hypothetical protein [Pseudoalteromonas aurantia 208]MBQ4845219.1 hypothetical protein [Pseudoalteromonas sp. MMG005]